MLLRLISIVMLLVFSPLHALENFDVIFKSHHATMLIIEPSTGKISQANNAAEAFYGYPRLTSMSIQDINMLTPEQVKAERLQAKAENRNYFIFRHKIADGQVKTVKVYSSPIELEGKKLLFSIVFDITDQRQSQGDVWYYHDQLENMVDQQADAISKGKTKFITILLAGIAVLAALLLYLIYLLRIKSKAEKRARNLSMIVEQSPVAIATLDSDSRIVYCNSKFQHSRKDTNCVAGSKLENYLSIECLPEQQVHEISQGLTEHGQWIGEVEYHNELDQLVWERANVYTINSQAPATKSRYVVMIENISKEKHDEKQLRLAAAVLETAAEAVMICDKSGKIISVNKAFSNITGFSEQDAIGKMPDQVNAAEQDQYFYQNIMQSLNQGGFWQGEVCNKRKNGSTYYEWLTVSSQYDHKGELEAFVSLFSDITKKKQADDKIYTQANYDKLTGLANRNLFNSRFNQCIDLAERDQKKLALMYIDLDGFKHINDSLGHSAGDLLLTEAATRLSSSVRKSDTVARLGGDEFAIIMANNESVYSVEGVANKILKLIAEPYKLKDKVGYVTASIGVTFFPDDGTDAETLLRKADSAMYKSKENGRNMVQFFTKEMDALAQQRRLLEVQLRQAIVNEEFYLEFQPIHDAHTGLIKSAEALVRWNHPELGSVPPIKFIPLAEEIGLIHQLGEWILQQACNQASQWLAELKHNAPAVAVNISSMQFQKTGWVDTVAKVLASSALPAEKLTLEITESLLIADEVQTEKQLNELKALGVKLAIDDFGTGYSSLSYLRRFPIDALKIDKSFINELSKGKEDEAVVNAIISLAHNLQLNIVAEGVELETQKQWLANNNCQLIQGYLYSPSLKPSEFLSYCQHYSETPAHTN